ncbi:alpha/beta fold hydrolase [uncultured Thiodictyon sp.]|uniref:PHA/PHB synthase family protein n=1 Tax=uncultured Thiodictyon sp. TaxID=1846217 RepID=UPI0025F80373|nr:alpha/beta fold hydrolase [uncultured Thiodictyon sp.]
MATSTDTTGLPPDSARRGADDRPAPTPALAQAPLAAAATTWVMHPQELGERTAQLYADLWGLQWHGWERLLGIPDADPVSPNPADERFADPVWSAAPGWDLLKEWYLTVSRHTKDLIRDTPDLSEKDRRRAVFWCRQWLDAVAPTNCLWSNPVAIRKALETGGGSLAAGYRNFLADLKAGNVRMSDPADFSVGETLATTPGAVVLRNRLVEVIHYAPTRPQVYAEPVVIITPWINKFYVLDLTPKRSLVRFLLEQGLDVFITSWKNPGAELGGLRMDDYLLEGIQAAIEVACHMSGARQVHAVGYCIGGTALAMYLAWANRRFTAADVPVADWTLFTTLVDFEQPGDIEIFIDEASVSDLCSRMERTGYLDGRDMASAFRLLRSNGLIWHYVVHGWLYGEPPPPFDVLYWNMDTTRMPAAMHAWYLTELYLYNRLIQPGAVSLAGESLDLNAITQPLYAVAAQDDHIAPWEQAFRTINLVPGEKRFVLSSAGHILGILNPPVDPPKRTYWADAAHCPDQAEAWKARVAPQAGSWWDDWMTWLKPRSATLVPARPTSTADFPELAPAPGTYVREP